MNDDISESVSQRGRGEEIAENRRIYEVSDELRRRCQLYEAQFRDGQEHVSRLEVEQRVAEQYAKENGIWVPIHEIFGLGVPGPSGNENDTYVSNDIVYKVNNLLNSGSILKLFDKITWHNILFYDTFYAFYGFTGFEGRTYAYPSTAFGEKCRIGNLHRNRHLHGGHWFYKTEQRGALCQ